jgi:hypothetical protein
MSRVVKIILITASIVAFGYTAFDFFFASKGDQDLVQYQVVEVNPEFDTSIFDFLARSEGNIRVHEEDM